MKSRLLKFPAIPIGEGGKPMGFPSKSGKEIENHGLYSTSFGGYGEIDLKGQICRDETLRQILLYKRLGFEFDRYRVCTALK